MARSVVGTALGGIGSARHARVPRCARWSDGALRERRGARCCAADPRRSGARRGERRRDDRLADLQRGVRPPPRPQGRRLRRRRIARVGSRVLRLRRLDEPAPSDAGATARREAGSLRASQSACHLRLRPTGDQAAAQDGRRVAVVELDVPVRGRLLPPVPGMGRRAVRRCGRRRRRPDHPANAAQLFRLQEST